MPPIVTITFNPCIDKSTSVAALIPEKKLKCTLPKFEPGGGGLNVARAIKKLGGQSIAIYPAGGYTGKFLTQLLKQEGINTVEIETAKHTRENLIVLEESSKQQYRFGMPGQPQTESEWKLCLQAIEDLKEVEFLVASGSLPPGVPIEIFAEIARIARRKNFKLIVDTSGDALKLAVKEGVFLIKPNLHELSFLANVENLDDEKVKEATRQLIAEGGAEIIVVSLGASGAFYSTRSESHKISAPVVRRRSTVGAGDSMVAGIVFSLSHGTSIRESVQYGVASGSAATLNPGTELCRKEDVDRLFAEITRQH